MSANSTLILTMRSQFYHQIRSEFASHFPSVLHVEPFAPADIYTFLTKWPFTRSSSEEVPRIYGELTDRPTLKEMCRNPLVLAMYVANDQTGAEGSTPDTRTSFYDQIVEELLVARRSRQRGVAARKALREEREGILGELALRNLTDAAQPANSVSWSEALERVRQVYRLRTDTEASSRLDELAKDTGIFDEERPGESLRFIHLTFCEFLAAKRASLGRKRGWEDLLEHHRAMCASSPTQTTPRLREVFAFAVALVPPSARDEALDDVWALDDRELMGRCLLEAQSYGHPKWQKYVAEEAAAIVEVPATEWSHQWLERLHLFTVAVRDAQGWSTAYGGTMTVSMESLFSRLVGFDRHRLVALFTSYATHDAAAAFRLAETCGCDLVAEQPQLVIANCADPPFLDIALQRAFTSTHALEQWAPLLAEAALLQGAVASQLNSRPVPVSGLPVDESRRRLLWRDVGDLKEYVITGRSGSF